MTRRNILQALSTTLLAGALPGQSAFAEDNATSPDVQVCKLTPAPFHAPDFELTVLITGTACSSRPSAILHLLLNSNILWQQHLEGSYLSFFQGSLSATPQLRP